MSSFSLSWSIILSEASLQQSQASQVSVLNNSDQSSTDQKMISGSESNILMTVKINLFQPVNHNEKQKVPTLYLRKYFDYHRLGQS